MNDHTIGIDISKAHLDAYRLHDRRSERFSNDTSSLSDLSVRREGKSQVRQAARTVVYSASISGNHTRSES